MGVKRLLNKYYRPGVCPEAACPEDGGRQRTEDRGQRTEDGKQKTEGRGRMTEGGGPQLPEDGGQKSGSMRSGGRREWVVGAGGQGGSGAAADSGKLYGLDEVEIVVDSSARVSVELLPSAWRHKIFQEFTYINPAWKKARQYSTSLQPPEKYLYAYYTDKNDMLCVPRASLRWMIDFFQARKVGVHLVDNTVSVPMEVPATFTGEMVPDVKRVLGALWEKRFNIFGGRGEIAMVAAAALITGRGEKTLIVVKQKRQMYQWMDVLSNVTDLSAKAEDIGLIGDRHEDLDSRVIVGIDKSLYRCLRKLSFGHLVIDRCDVVNTKIFYQICWRFATRYITGIAGYDKREDGLAPLMAAFCGPIRARLADDFSSSGKKPVLEVYEAPGLVDGQEYAEVLDSLCDSFTRNRRIAEDVLAAAAAGQRVVVVSARTGHIEQIAGLLDEQLRPSVTITGKTKDVARKTAIERFSGTGHADPVSVLMTTTKTVVDLEVENVDAVFVVAPFKYRDTATNIVCRIRPGGRLVEYEDAHPFLKSSFNKRLEAYKDLGVVPAV